MAKKTIGYIELHWHCPHCGTQNPGTVKTCISCGSPQPEDIVFEQNPAGKLIEDAEQLHTAQQSPDVHCPYCGTRNIASAAICSQCGGDLKDGIRRVKGRILGAYQEGQAASTADVPCPSCRQPNNPLAAFCVHCGAPMQQQKPREQIPASKPAVAAAPVATPRKTKKIPIFLIILFILLSIGCVAGILIAILSGGGSNDPIQGTVTGLYWERRIDLWEQQTVVREDWLDDISGSDRVISCEERYHHTQSNPATGAVEVCGTPYSVDQGNGYAEVVQDCEYDIYADYCSYETQDWVLVDTFQTSGNDQYPYWADVNPGADQKIGDQTEQYTITLNADGESYRYTTDDAVFFQQVEYGSHWWIKTGLFGSIQSITPVE